VILAPGIYPDIPEAAYHADPAPEPSLSHSVAVELIERSPMHAWQKHPRLGGGSEFEADSKMDIGKAIHAGLTRTEAALAIVDADDWRTKAAKEQRAAAHAAGQVPLLRKQFEEARAAIDAARAQLRAHEVGPDWTEGRGELTIVWKERVNDRPPIFCRARIDWAPAGGHAPLYDLKTTTGDAAPQTWARRLYGDGYDVQAAFYARGARAVGLRPERSEFRFVVLEQKPPYALSVIGVPPDAIAAAEEKVALALDLWSICRNNGAWPGYPGLVCYADMPAWEFTKTEQLKDRARQARESGGHIAAHLLHWQRPPGFKPDAAKGDVS
jgi:hypothetical protein